MQFRSPDNMSGRRLLKYKLFNFVPFGASNRTIKISLSQPVITPETDVRNHLLHFNWYSVFIIL